MKAILVKDNLQNFNGHAALYRMEPPLDGHEFVIASASKAMFTGPETYIFPADADGEVVSWAEMEGSYRGGLSHAKAFAGAGYSIEQSKLPGSAGGTPAAPDAQGYVQPVPEKCDRIVWRGNYYHLPPAAQVADSVREDAARYRCLKSQSKEQLLNPRGAASEFCADMRTHWKLPVLMCSGPIGGYLSFDDSVDILRAAQEGK